MRETFFAVVVTFEDDNSINDSFGGLRTIATRAKLISFRIMNETRKPDHDKKYRTTLAGTNTAIEKKKLTGNDDM